MKQKKAIENALWELGYSKWSGESKDWDRPNITIQDKINAICKHLGIYIIKTPTVVIAQKETLPRRSKK